MNNLIESDVLAHYMRHGLRSYPVPFEDYDQFLKLPEETKTAHREKPEFFLNEIDGEYMVIDDAPDDVGKVFWFLSEAEAVNFVVDAIKDRYDF